MITGVLEVQKDHFINWNKTMRVDFATKEGVRSVYVQFERDEQMISYGEVTPEHEAYVKRQLRGESGPRSAGF